MALTREERQAIETLIKKIRAVELKVDSIEKTLAILQNIVDKIGSSNDMNDWTSEQWDAFLKPYILKYAKQAKPVKHDHTNDQQGGDCFAKLGANLIE